jgi:hypothetical protein
MAWWHGGMMTWWPECVNVVGGALAQGLLEALREALDAESLGLERSRLLQHLPHNIHHAAPSVQRNRQIVILHADLNHASAKILLLQNQTWCLSNMSSFHEVTTFREQVNHAARKKKSNMCVFCIHTPGRDWEYPINTRGQERHVF